MIEYKVASYTEVNQEIGVKVLVGGIPRKLSDAEARVINKAIDEILEEVQKENLRLDPQTERDAEEEELRLLSLFPCGIYAEKIPNGYCSRHCCAFKPWFMVTTPRGRIKIGWRKRVIEINWADSEIEHNGMRIFAKENVTAGDCYVHAWEYDKAREYIKTLLAGN